MSFLVGLPIFRGYVKFPGCMSIGGYWEVKPRQILFSFSMQVHHLELRHQQVQLFTAFSGQSAWTSKELEVVYDRTWRKPWLNSEVSGRMPQVVRVISFKEWIFWVSKILWWLAHTRQEASEQYQTLHHQEACHLGLLSALCEHSAMKYFWDRMSLLMSTWFGG